ncbi:hypothetical protein [Methylobacterium nodulans]|uniref:Uncharacterized protein n=1 Tax=Methylobacterium nodulans (strain LMG 21967 / CNCM I-2342 / ORS 2060) TaxID=460265 RepID=B8ISF6_METNO|nr:hypothetical protein [Methylobacterium nodulans]ACL58796.1 conserved hypothetical protein [Methylobacterium nodulans ORS 2060]
MRIAIITAAVLAGIGAAALTEPAAALPIGSSQGVAAPEGIISEARVAHHHMRRARHRRFGVMRRGGRFNNVTRGAPAGYSRGNAVTGSTAAPSGR